MREARRSKERSTVGQIASSNRWGFGFRAGGVVDLGDAGTDGAVGGAGEMRAKIVYGREWCWAQLA